MVKQACDVMLLYAYVCVPARLSVLLEERVFSVEFPRSDGSRSKLAHWSGT